MATDYSPVRTKSLKELLALPQRQVPYILEPQLLGVGGSMVFYGMAGTLKSWLAVDLAFAFSTGSKWLDIYQTSKVTTLIVQGEVTESDYQRRMVKYCAHLNGSVPDNIFFDNDLELKLDGFVGLNVMLQDIAERKPDVVILDCMYQLMAGSVSAELDLKKLVNNLDKVKNAGISIVLIHHPRKEGDDDRGYDEMLGHSVLRNWLDTIVRVRGLPEGASQPTVVELEFQKVKNAEQEMQNIRVRFDRETVRFNLR